MSYRSDDEQVELIKSWWRENGRSVIAGVVIALAALVGWQQWNAYQEREAEAASSQYMAFLAALDDQGAAPEAVVERGEAIVAEFGDTAYGPLTALWLAQHHVKQGELEAATERLRWVVAEADSEAVVALAQLRLAQVLAARTDYGAALALLEQAPAGFGARYRELAGDILAAQGQAEQAVGAYRQALADDTLDPQRRGLIELKLNDLGVSAEPVS